MIIATAGHVDHGKTSLVKSLTGIDTDRLAEEKKRGLTIELGFAYTKSERGESIGFVDVPGHSRFITNMLAGVSTIDATILVVACDDGVMPQTLEHLQILELLGLENGFIVLTKIDRCEEAQVKIRQDEIRREVANSFLQDCPIIPASSASGAGIEDVKQKIEELLREKRKATTQGLFRLSVDRRFLLQGTGLIATGTVADGEVHEGDEIWLMPSKIKLKARSLRVNSERKKLASLGDRCAINLTGENIKLSDVKRGNWLTKNPGDATTKVVARLKLLNSSRGKLKNFSQVHFHAGANHTQGRLVLHDGEDHTIRETRTVTILLSQEINLCYGDHFIIRDQSASITLGGGRILNPYPPENKKRALAERETLNLFKFEDIKRDILIYVRGLDTSVSIKKLVALFNLPEDTLLHLIKMNNLTTIKQREVISESNLKDLEQRIEAFLREWQQKKSSERGVPESSIYDSIEEHSSDSISHAIESLILKRRIAKYGNVISLSGYRVQLDSKSENLWKRLSPILREAWRKPPVIHDLAKELRLEPKKLEQSLVPLIKAGLILRPIKNRYFLPETLEDLKNDIFKSADSSKEVSVKSYRDLTGIGRNLSIEILEYFDRQGVTRRIGDTRQIIE